MSDVSRMNLRLRSGMKMLFYQTGLLGGVRKLFNLPVDPNEAGLYRRFLDFKRRSRKALRYRADTPGSVSKCTVLVSGKDYPLLEPELGLIKSLETAGCEPVVLMHRAASLTLDGYSLAVRRILFWEDYLGEADPAEAETILGRYGTMRELAKYEYEGVRVGLFAVSTALRDLRIGSLDWGKSPEQHQVLVRRLAASLQYTRAALQVIRLVHPDKLLFLDGVYTPEAELVDACVENGVEGICWHPAHRDNTLILKRYTAANKSADRASLSNKTWDTLLQMPWSERRSQELERELYGAYASGAWYADAGTQFHKRMLSPDQVRAAIGLDQDGRTDRKTAFIFPHIMWDASLSRGVDLFRDYQDWFVQTVMAACRNEQVDWVIKIHPAHVGKAAQDGYRGEPAEVSVLHQVVGELPPHVYFIPADSPISTYSLFPVMDYCLTVRGTIGMEAARLGIPVLTAGTGRYDRRGFTVDSDSARAFLEKVAHIQDFPALTPAQRETAERLAYGVFILRPFAMQTISLAFNNTETYRGVCHFNVQKAEDWADATDLHLFVDWVLSSGDEDFLSPLPDPETSP